MSGIDPTTRAGPPPPSVAAANAPNAGPSARGEPVPTEKEQPTGRATAKQVLDAVASEALAYPPQNIATLSASAAKFLLTDLGPALRLAQQIREQVATPEQSSVPPAVDDERREATLALLTTESPDGSE